MNSDTEPPVVVTFELPRATYVALREAAIADGSTVADDLRRLSIKRGRELLRNRSGRRAAVLALHQQQLAPWQIAERLQLTNAAVLFQLARLEVVPHSVPRPRPAVINPRARKARP